MVSGLIGPVGLWVFRLFASLISSLLALWWNTCAQTGSEPSIPSKIGQIILKLLDEEELPLRLVIGPDAVLYANFVGEALAASDEKWRELSLSSA